MRLAGLLILFLFLSLSPAKPTSHPEGSIVSPSPWSVINSNGIRVQAEATDTVCGIDRVVFMARYVDAAIREGKTDTIAIDSTDPYEAVWNVRSLPDQGWLDLKIYCDIINTAQKRKRTPPTFLILDRNPSHSQQSISAGYIDGGRNQSAVLDYFREKKAGTALTLENDNNRYTLKTAYSPEKLFFRIDVEDNSFFNRHANARAWPLQWKQREPQTHIPIPRVWEDDCLILLFDTHNRKPELPERSTRMLYVLPNGRFYAVYAEPHDARFTNWSHLVDITVDSTLSRGSVPLRRFLITIPWNSLGRKPDAPSSMGFQVYFSDRDRMDGERVISAWCGEPHNQNNPSEWGTLTLVPPARPWPLVLGVALIAGLVGFLAFLRQRTRIGNRAVPKSPPPQPQAATLQKDSASAICQKAIELIETQYEEPSLSRTTLARQLRLSASYLSSIFNRQMGISLPAYINNYRLEQARILLSNPSNSVSAVALKVGYNSPDHFIRKFKSAYSVTPKQYQLRARNHSS